MNAETLNALQQSIEHWRRMGTGNSKPDEEPGWPSCALCALFRKERADSRITCDGCPVMERTGKNGCDGTPYEKAQESFDKLGADSKEFELAAKDELEFLESLLPKAANLTQTQERSAA